jgi:imidazole glycerol phosphate synthase glutamine amidotransferase subunit
VLFESSDEEPGAPGAGVFAGTVDRLPSGVKIPHIGWNTVMPRAGSRLFAGIEPETRFYFVHSFAPAPADPEVCAATTEYGIRFCCAAERDNVMATQFHPEKSGDAGADLLANFIEVCA